MAPPLVLLASSFLAPRPDELDSFASGCGWQVGPCSLGFCWRAGLLHLQTVRLDTCMSYQLSKKEVPPPWVSSCWREVLQGLGLDELAPPGMNKVSRDEMPRLHWHWAAALPPITVGKSASGHKGADCSECCDFHRRPSTAFPALFSGLSFLPCLQAFHVAISHHRLHRVLPVLRQTPGRQHAGPARSFFLQRPG